ncbi:MAG: hypothetical protein QGF00_26310 [Planctomycetota bacterium]|jgi:hypothetical protein|nr:hypothetical protein [Planctomycetota bacterium]MDP7253144.1 hypothetical protein [Planctomycetota bacterium]
MAIGQNVIQQFEDGFLVCLKGKDRGRAWPLGKHGLVYDPVLGWLPHENAPEGERIRLFKYADYARVENNGADLRVLGENVEDAAKVPINGRIELNDSLYRVYFLSLERPEIIRTEQELRSESTHSLNGHTQSHDTRSLKSLISDGLASFFEEHWDGYLQRYASDYLEDPLEVIRRQNKFLAGIKGPDQQEAARQFMQLNARLEGGLFLQAPEKSGDTYDEINNVLYFAQNDYLPGHRFVLGDASTYNREKLRIEKTSFSFGSDEEKSLIDFFVGAKLCGAELKDDWFAISLRLFSELTQRFSPLPNVEGRESTTIVIQDFFEEGGVCRHKCAVLQVALQEAGVSSRYHRGKLFFGGYHAWIEVDIFRDGSYFLILDPHLFHVLIKSGTLETSQGAIYLRDEGYPVTEHFNTVWRGKPVGEDESVRALEAGVGVE